jgi:hypothetical protein
MPTAKGRALMIFKNRAAYSVFILFLLSLFLPAGRGFSRISAEQKKCLLGHLQQRTGQLESVMNKLLANIQSAVAVSDREPTKPCYENFEELSAELDVYLAELENIKKTDIPGFNQFLHILGIPPILIVKFKEE